MVSIVLVEPQIPGNIGAIARIMMNFGFHDLRMVNPCELDDSAYARSMHARKILENSVTYGTLEEATQDCTLIIGTSSVINENRDNKIRHPLVAEEFFSDTDLWDDKAAIVFGSEDVGLKEDDLRKCDVLLTVPASQEYPVLNLSHAAGIILYELSKHMGISGKKKETHLAGMHIRSIAGSRDRTLFLDKVDILMEKAFFPEHKRANARTMLKRLLGRAGLTEMEFRYLIGIITRSIKRIEYLDNSTRNNNNGEDE